MQRRFEQKTVLVTGAGSGIGRASAQRFLAEGAHVHLVGRRAPALEETLQTSAAPDKGRILVCDVTDVDAVDNAVAHALDDGPIHVLVNNAGLGGPNALSGPGEDRWRDILAVNLDGVFFVTRAVVAGMPEGSAIVNVSSVLGKFGVPGYTAYCTSKHGIIGFTRALALEVASRRITVNAVCPGWTDTEMARQGMDLLAAATGASFEDARRDALSLVPLGRMIEPGEVAGLIAWLASAEASGMTGQAVNLSGGSAMW